MKVCGHLSGIGIWVTHRPRLEGRSSYRDQIFRRDRILNKSPMTHTISPKQMQDKNGGWTNPPLKNMLVKLRSSSPNFRGENKKSVSCHHLEESIYWNKTSMARIYTDFCWEDAGRSHVSRNNWLNWSRQITHNKRVRILGNPNNNNKRSTHVFPLNSVTSKGLNRWGGPYLSSLKWATKA